MKRSVWIVCLLVLSSNAWIYLALASEGGATRQASITADILRNKGFNVRKTYWHGFLNRRDATYITTTLYKGNSYGLVIGGCGDAYDVDVLLYDENWNLISRDTSTDAWGVVTVKPRWTGKYYIKVQMYNSKYDGAHWTLLFAYV